MCCRNRSDRNHSHSSRLYTHPACTHGLDADGYRAKTRMLLAGRTSAAEWPKACKGCGSAKMRPSLPTASGFTQFSYTSLLKIACGRVTVVAVKKASSVLSPK